MSIKIGNYDFQGPYSNKNSIAGLSGVYVVLDRNRNGGYTVVDIGESANIKTRLNNHDRESCWQRNISGQITFAAIYTTEQSRMRIEKLLREKYAPACGVR